MKITVLNENHVKKRGLCAEHGLSLLLKEGEERWLFDTGQSDVYIKNAETLGEKLDGLSGIILSHGHYDHCGGLAFFREKPPKIYVRECAFLRKFAHNFDGSLREIGIPWDKTSFLEHLLFTEETQKIRENWFLLGNVVNDPDLETGTQGFVYEGEQGMCEDAMEDEQFLTVKTKTGLILIVGCAHMGILSCIAHAKRKFPGEKVRGIFAGMHMDGVDDRRIEKTIEKLKEEKLEFLIGAHCTGQRTIAKMAEAFGEVFQFCETGKTFTFL